ncbi:thiol:disulfide interchange protein tlpA [Asticcacaulis biprosthecium C19]|uniref:Thiol:disulfide interchange protein tlpA n=1 Tax=Asticcacaulis biprosthecium C19 TaxID=715226 RepID=F4QGS5_9CAUL|nr:thiol:disulfide interchange protein tlpA [Asticcacaulis biprosthecium C19]
MDSDDLKAAPAPRPDQPAQPIAEDSAEPKWRDTGKAKKKRGLNGLTIAIIVASIAAVGVLGFAGWKLLPQLFSGQAKGIEGAVKAEAEGPLAPYVKGSISHMITFATPRKIDNLAFIDRDKKPLRLADFKGQVVVLNLWATWCAPCRYEMPTLANLQKHYAGKGVAVVALSGDTEDKFADVKSFIDVQQPLEVYVDPDLVAKTSKLDVAGLPSTLILNKNGDIVARLDGEASWDTPEVKALLDKLLTE